MGISTDNDLTGHNDTLFRQQGVFDAHLTYVKKVFYFHIVSEGAAGFALLCRLNVFVGRKVIQNDDHLIPVEDFLRTCFLKFFQSNSCCDVVAHDNIQFCLDQLSGFYAF